MKLARSLAYRFLSLPYHKQVGVAQDLKIKECLESGLTSLDMGQRIFGQMRNNQEKLEGSIAKYEKP